MKKALSVIVFGVILSLIMSVQVFAAVPQTIFAPTTSVKITTSTNLKTVTTSSHPFGVSATVAPTGANPAVNWVSTNPDVIKITGSPNNVNRVQLTPVSAGTTTIIAYSQDGLKVATQVIKVTDDKYPVSIGTLQFVENDLVKDKFVVKKSITGDASADTNTFTFKVRVNAQLADKAKTTISDAADLNRLVSLQSTNSHIKFVKFTNEDGATYANFSASADTKVTGTVTMQAKDAKAVKSSLSVTANPVLNISGSSIDATNTKITYTFNRAIQLVKEGEKSIISANKLAANKAIFNIYNVDDSNNYSPATKVEGVSIKSVVWSASKNSLTITLDKPIATENSGKFIVDAWGYDITCAGVKAEDIADDYKFSPANAILTVNKLPSKADDLNLAVVALVNTHAEVDSVNKVIKVEQGYVGNIHVAGKSSNEAKVTTTVKTTAKTANGTIGKALAGAKLSGTNYTIPTNAPVGEYKVVFTVKLNAKVSKDFEYTLRVTNDYNPALSFKKAVSTDPTIAAKYNRMIDILHAEGEQTITTADGAAAEFKIMGPVITYHENNIYVNKNAISKELLAYIETVLGNEKSIIRVGFNIDPDLEQVLPYPDFESKVVPLNLAGLHSGSYGAESTKRFEDFKTDAGVIAIPYNVIVNSNQNSTLALENLTFENAPEKTALYEALYNTGKDTKNVTYKVNGEDVTVSVKPKTITKDAKNNITINMNNLTPEVTDCVESVMGPLYAFPVYNAKVTDGTVEDPIVTVALNQLTNKAVTKGVNLTEGSAKTLPYTVKGIMGNSTLSFAPFSSENNAAYNELMAKLFTGNKTTSPIYISGTTITVKADLVTDELLQEMNRVLNKTIVELHAKVKNGFAKYTAIEIDLGNLVKGTYPGSMELTGGTVSQLSYKVVVEKATTAITGVSIQVPVNGVKVGEILTAVSAPEKAKVKYQWSMSASKTSGFKNIADATQETLVVPADALGKYIRVTVTPINANFTGTKTATTADKATTAAGEAVITNAMVKARHEAGVLAAGQPEQINDNKFLIESYTMSDRVITINAKGTKALEAETGGAPSEGKWIGMRVQLIGVTDIATVSFSKDNKAYTALELDTAIAADAQSNSFMHYFDGSNKTGTRYLKDANGNVYTVIVNFTPLFVSTTNNSTANDEATLGLIGTAVQSSKPEVATAAIVEGKIAITSVSEGSALIAVEIEKGYKAIIEVTVNAEGNITLGKITKFDKAVLDAAITKEKAALNAAYKAYKEENYGAEQIVALNNILDAGLAAIEDATTPAEAAEAKEAAIKAMKAVKTLSVQITELVTYIGTLKEAEYTVESWQAVKTAMALPQTTKAEKVAKLEALESAVEGLVKVSAPAPITVKDVSANTATTSAGATTPISLVGTYESCTGSVNLPETGYNYYNLIYKVEGTEGTVTAKLTKPGSATAEEITVPAIAEGKITFTGRFSSTTAAGAYKYELLVDNVVKSTVTLTAVAPAVKQDLTKANFTLGADGTVSYAGGITVAEAGAITVEYFNNSTSLGNAIPTAAGTYTVKVTTAGGTKYNALTTPTALDGSFTVTVAKVTPVVNAAPTVSGAVYGTELTISNVPTAKVSASDSTVVPGSWDITSSKTPDVGTVAVTVTFTPTNTSLYNSFDYNVAGVAVTAKPLTFTGEAEATYNPAAQAGAGTVSVAIGNLALDGVLLADQASVEIDFSTAAGTISGATNAEAVTITGVKLRGSRAANYSLSAQPTSNTVDASQVIAADAAVTNLNLTSMVTAPVKGAAPSVTAIDNVQYTGAIEWTPTAANFAADTVYTATVTLAAKSGYTFTGVAANSFTYTGATTVTNAADSGVVTIVFPKTAAELIAVNNEVDSTYNNITYAGAAIDASKAFKLDANAGAPTYSVVNGAAEGTINASTGELTLTKAGGSLTIKVSTAATSTHAAGAEISRSIYFNKGTQLAPATSISFDGDNAFKLMGATTVMEYSLNNGGRWFDCTENIDLSGNVADMSGNIQVRLKATDLYNSGSPQSISITKASIPSGITFSFSDATNPNMLMSTTAEMQYSLDGGASWTDCTADKTDLSNKLNNITDTHGINVRVKGKNTALPSDNMKISITRVSITPPTVVKTVTNPTSEILIEEGAGKFTATIGSMYNGKSFEYTTDDGTTWKPLLAGDNNLTAGNYTFKVRECALNTALPGPASMGISVTISA